jgi:hypothetical protein
MKEILPILMLIAGTVLGLLSSLFASAIQYRRTLEVKLFEQYLSARQNVAEVLAPLTNADVLSAMSRETRLQARDSVAILYYRHFDFLPIEVLDSLVRLQTAIDHPEGGPISLNDGMVAPMERQDIPKFIDECSLLKNSSFFACIVLNSSDEEAKRIHVIKLHAQHVLFQMNKFASIDRLKNIQSTMSKQVTRVSKAHTR